MRHWMGGVATVMGLALGACGGSKKEPTPSERVAQVVDKGAPAKPTAETAKAPPTKAPEPTVAPDPAPRDPAPAPKETAPVAVAEPTPAPKEELVAKVEPAPKEEPVAKVEPAPKEEPTPIENKTPSGQAMHPITVNDSAMTPAIDNRFPSERRTSFKIGTDAKVYAWFDFKNAGTKTPLTLVWKKDGKEVWRIDTNVGVSKSWRTWAEKKIGKKDAGRWSVDAIDAGGHVYGTVSYEVLPEG